MDTFDRKWIIFEGLSGSKLYGTDNEFSDTDIRGVCIPDRRCREDPFHNFEQQQGRVELGEGEDTVYYGLKKFFQLCSDCNPNILELLFIPVDKSTVYSDSWKSIIYKKDLFLSLKIRNTFMGYAYSQLKKLELHRQWLTHPPKEKPSRVAFGLPEVPLFGLESINAILSCPSEFVKEEYSEYALLESKYRTSKQQWDNYSTWLNERNRDRFELEKKYGYDTKFAMHLIRLLYEGIELLETGNLVFPLQQKDFLKDVRSGFLSYDQLIEYADELKLAFDTTPSTLPDKPDYKALQDLYFDTVYRYDAPDYMWH